MAACEPDPYLALIYGLTFAEVVALPWWVRAVMVDVLVGE